MGNISKGMAKTLQPPIKIDAKKSYIKKLQQGYGL
jgi:hypothetical protein